MTDPRAVVAEQYLLQVHSEQESEQLCGILEARQKRSPPQAVAVLDFWDVPARYCSTSISLQVTTEHLHPRLADLTDLSRSQGLIILCEGLRGYHSLRRQYGLNFVVTDRMLGYLNDHFEIKVWVNENLAACSTEPVQLRDQDREHTFIADLAALIASHCLVPLELEDLYPNKLYRFQSMIAALQH